MIMLIDNKNTFWKESITRCGISSGQSCFSECGQLRRWSLCWCNQLAPALDAVWCWQCQWPGVTWTSCGDRCTWVEKMEMYSTVLTSIRLVKSSVLYTLHEMFVISSCTEEASPIGYKTKLESVESWSSRFEKSLIYQELIKQRNGN